MLGNLFGTIERARYIFRDTYEMVRRLIELKVDPDQFRRHPLRYARAAPAALRMRPRRVGRGPVLQCQTTIDQLPQLRSWPLDGGAFITLPQVYSEDPQRPGPGHANLGMYRVQLSGNRYRTNHEVGLHYQIHRGIGVHHAAAIRRGEPLRVNIFVGGTPAMTLAAVMPLPEGLSELGFAGALAGHRIRLAQVAGKLPIYADADFCIVGRVDPDRRLPEGPFGDHLGYYSLTHDYPVLQVEQVWHRRDAIWPFTVVGRPPQEDTVFGQLIHELTGPVVPSVLPGVQAVHAVDAAGVHPLMLAIGSERYVPYQEIREPQELLTQANAILGQGQMSLAKYLLIVNQHDQPDLDIHDIPGFFTHLLARIDWRRDVHFHTRTTIDTLDYSGNGLNQGSKVVMAATGPAIRELATTIPADLTLPHGFDHPRVCLPGVLAVNGPDVSQQMDTALRDFCGALDRQNPLNEFALILVTDDSEFTSRSTQNFLWVAFTRSNPAADIDGIEAFHEQKHWGCRGALVIDARIKPQHAPPLIEDPEITKKVDARAARGGPLARYL
jgi:4-hydroxy-3-polyprenylbenzoate decarboxylase